MRKIFVKKLLVYLKYLMPAAAVLCFAAYLFYRSVFFIDAEGDVKQRQALKDLASSTYATSTERLEKLESGAEQDSNPNDESFARSAIVYTVISRVGLWAAIFFSVWAAIFALLAITLPPVSPGAMRYKLLLRLVVPNKWFMALCPLLCLPYACLPDFIVRMYKKYYLFEVTVGYAGPAPKWVLLAFCVVCVAVLYAAENTERELKMDAYRRYVK